MGKRQAPRSSENISSQHHRKRRYAATCQWALVVMGVLLPKLGSPVPPGRGETAYIFDSVAFVLQYPRTLCACTTALRTVFFTTTRSCFQLLTGPTQLHKTNHFHSRVCVCHWGPPCSSDYFADVSKKWKQPSEGHPCVSSLSASPFSHHSACRVCREECPKREMIYGMEKNFFYR